MSLSKALASPGPPIVGVQWSSTLGRYSTFLKLGLRASGGPNWGAVAVSWGGLADPNTCTVAIGSLGENPRRVPEAEERWYSLAKAPEEAAAAAGRAAAATVPFAQSCLAEKQYQRHLIEVLVQRAFLNLIQASKEE